MKQLQEAIQKQGKILSSKVLKVDAFLNHQIDPCLMQAVALSIYEHFQTYPINKIVTIESSGIAPAILVAQQFQVPLVFLKKSKPITMQDSIYCANVHSYTKNKDYILTGSSEFLSSKDHVLIVDDMLANGEACMGALQILKQANAQVEGIAILIEKAFQDGRSRLEALGHDVFSLVKIKKMHENTIIFE